MKTFKPMTLHLLFIFTVFIMIGCNRPDSTLTQERFNAFTNDVFIEEVQSDSITLNYTLTNPINYGIDKFTPTLGEYTLEEFSQDLSLSENYLARLKEFNYKQLTNDQQLTYDILMSYLVYDTDMGDYLLFFENLSPTIGIQAQLPVLYAEYNFYKKDNIDEYLELLPLTYSYFQQILDFQKLKSQNKLFMSDSSADDIIKQCMSFIKDKEDNFLITVFNDKVASFKGLTKKEIRSYQETNKDAVLNYVIPAYELLINGLTDLKGTGVNEGGLANFKDGKKYYENLVKIQTGSSKSIEELIKLTDQTMKVNITNMQQVISSDPTALESMLNVSYKLTDPVEIIEYLKESVKENYPPLEDVNYTIKYVDESLQEHLSPAFYLTPALDNWTENNIYINKGEQFDLSTIFTTIAHEGYPGHLYQCVYFNQQKPDPIRSILNFGGYSEGWATYVELDSYYLAGLDEHVATLLEKNLAATLSMYARLDIGINYEGWTKEKTSTYLTENIGISDEETISELFKSMIEEPTNYLKYSIGYLEFKELRDKAIDKLGSKFVLKDFHEFILSTGPAPFDVINKYLTVWMSEQK